ncbi:YlzJ-like family protein [Pelosinus propionicus]|uniref:YlzJ-like protein n=1 Tax=Pelosinus propionicus DSM 13327 TaxID=1123291 RepID=A0A1I4HBY2_9FIRM|nr:YlzJ-like family protein [Pelosinus propionicus]SFL39097.1 YlzJ-like protein [Pelosinus propionicus DSM 13327]
MIFWSILPEEYVFSTNNLLDSSPLYEEIQCNNIKLLVEKMGPTQCKISRLLTTNPQDYLLPDIQPGNILTYKPI